MNKSVAHRVAAHLLEIEAIKLSVKKPFTWASGWKSPIYCDNRLSLSYPKIRTFIKERLADVIKNEFEGVEAIAGVATAGIPQGALVAEVLGLPFIYVRSKPKEHGMTNMIEGKVSKKQKVVMVEDLISTGGSSIKAAKAVQEAGMKVLGMAAIFTYGFEVAKENFAKEEIKVVTLSDYASMLEEATALKYISEKELISLKAWRVDPENWK
ncbi:MAG: orotate phosphoribosyltransferase [Cyclobacteriaceae bacterium]|nr:orotate phosphoribosyltransferase [Cyclobacteriaceae bacterium]